MSFYDSTDAIYGVARYGAASYGVASPNVSLTGVTATGSIQTVAVTGFEIDISEKVGGVSATTTAGSVTVNVVEVLGSICYRLRR